jgi:EmrB/QacA subfamily drug resistance transporter
VPPVRGGAADAPEAMTPRQTRLLLAAMLSGLLLAMLDQTIVGTALPTIVTSLGGGSLYAWAVTAYIVPATVSLPIYARLSDRYGRRDLLLVGMGLFLAGSALSATAGSMGQLVAWRAVQGLGAGALEGLSFILVADLFRARRSVAWQSAMAALMAFSLLGGPLLGGVLCDHLGWRSVFTVNLPIGIAAMVVVARVLPRSLGRSERRDVPPDYAGMVLLTGAIGLTLLGLSRRGMPVPGSDQLRSWAQLSTGGAIAAGLALLVAFLFVERQAAAPLLPLRLLRDRKLAAIMVTGTAASFAMFASVLLLPRYFQQAGHVSATHSGLLIYPLLLGVLLSVNLGAALMVRTLAFRRVLLGGCALVCIGALGFATFDAHTPGWQSSVFMALIGLGVGPTFSGLQIAVQRSVAPADMGAAMGTLILLRQLGGTVALAAAETIYIGGLAGVHTQQAAATATGTGVFAISLAGALIAIAALASLPRAARRLPQPAPA